MVTSSQPPENLKYHDQEVYKCGFTTLDNMRRNGKLCDITLICDDCRFTAHKVVLAATIPFFNGMFLSNMSESLKKEIVIYGLDSCALEAFVNFAYTGLVQINSRNVQSILIGANFLQLNNVRSVCCKYISERLNVDIVLPMRKLAQSFLCIDLVSVCDTFIFQNFESVARTPSFLNLEGFELIKFIESDELNVSSEEQIFFIIMSWVEFETNGNKEDKFKLYIQSTEKTSELNVNCGDNENNKIDLISTYAQNDFIHNQSRLSYLPDLLKCIRFSLISVDFIFSVISRHPLIRCSILCRDFIDGIRDALLMPEKALKTFNYGPRRCQDVFGAIYAVGGLTKNGDCHDLVEAFHPSLGRWELTEHMLSKRSRIGVVSLNGLIYAIGGFDGFNRLNKTEVFNPKTKKWKTVAPMNCRRSAMGAATLRGYVYICGGYNGQMSLRTCEMYDPETDVWHVIPSMNEPRSAGGLVALNDDCLYALGGHNGLAVFSSVESYNPRTNSNGRLLLANKRNSSIKQHQSVATIYGATPWTPVASMRHRRCRLGATVFRDRIIVAGGYCGSSFLSSVEMFDPLPGPNKNGLMGQWTEIRSMSVPRSRVGLAVTAGVLYAIGGYDGISNLQTVECFKPPASTKYNFSLFSQSKQINCDNVSNLLLQSPNLAGHGSSFNESSGYTSQLMSSSLCWTTPTSTNCSILSTNTNLVGDNQKTQNERVENYLEGQPKLFSNWNWSFASPLIAHEGWVGICVLPLDN